MLKLDETTINFVENKIMEVGKDGLLSNDLYSLYDDIDQKVLIAKAINHLTKTGVVEHNPIDKRYRYNTNRLIDNAINRICNDKPEIKKTEEKENPFRVIKGNYDRSDNKNKKNNLVNKPVSIKSLLGIA